MRVHLDPLLGTITTCPDCGSHGLHLCPAEDLRRQGWQAALLAAARLAASCGETDLAREIHAMPYDLDGGDQ